MKKKSTPKRNVAKKPIPKRIAPRKQYRRASKPAARPLLAAPSLYERLGGVYAIAAVVDDFIDRLMDDARLNANPKVDEAHHRVSRSGFKYLVTEQVCQATGGPRDSGRSMRDSHQDLAITPGDGTPSSTTSARPSTNSRLPPNAGSYSRPSTARGHCCQNDGWFNVRARHDIK
jgi:hypothetical protein